MASFSRSLSYTLGVFGLIAISVSGCSRSEEPTSATNATQGANVTLDKASLRVKDAKGNIHGDTDNAALHDWQAADPDADHLAGTSADRAYKELGLGEGKTIVVAVIDSGVDIKHEDLKGHIWINEKELNGAPGQDNDGNGYANDVFGWNFIGGRDGRNTSVDTLEVTREVVRLRKLKASLEASGGQLSNEDAALLGKVEKEVKTGLADARKALQSWTQNETALKDALANLTKAMGVTDPTLDQIRKFETSDARVERDRQLVIRFYEAGFNLAKVEEAKQTFSNQVNYQYNVNFDPRHDIVGDNYDDLTERNYGNNDVTGSDASHGTHCSGIIAALRDNGIGMNGIASNVKIMPIRTVPNGDERDKDVANAVRYAVDNGAQIISMSFGKNYSPHKDVVDAAFQYAAHKGVLLVHAAGNDSKDNDKKASFPNRYVKGQENAQISTWIEVGASTRFMNEQLPADFSNYGQKSVDLFAPGHEIYSTVPGGKYDTYSGTSMATPVVSGVAALVWSQYPSLTAVQVKDVLVKSITPYRDLMVRIPQADPDAQAHTARFDSLSQTGGVVDAYHALQVAATLAQ